MSGAAQGKAEPKDPLMEVAAHYFRLAEVEESLREGVRQQTMTAEEIYREGWSDGAIYNGDFSGGKDDDELAETADWQDSRSRTARYVIPTCLEVTP